VFIADEEEGRGRKFEGVKDCGGGGRGAAYNDLLGEGPEVEL
jgi:hypothetical protein